MRHLVYTLPLLGGLTLLTAGWRLLTGSSLAIHLPLVFFCFFVGARCIRRRE